MRAWWRAIRRFYTTPFATELSVWQGVALPEIESRRQEALARLIISQLVAIQVVGVVLAALSHSPPAIVIAQIASVVFAAVCLFLLFTRFVKFGIALYVYGIFVLIALIGRIDPAGISLRTMLVNILLALFILLSGLLLPRWSIWLATGLSIAATLINLAISPLDPALRLGSEDPKMLIGTFMAVFFFCIALLGLLLANSAAAGARSILRAYEQERALADLKDQFIIYINHELRTPLMGLYGNVELVRKLGDRLNAQGRNEMLERALQAGNAILTMLSTTLDSDILKPEAVQIRPESLALAPLVRGIIERFDPREIGEPGLEGIAFATRDITLSIPDDLTVYADPLRVQQIVINLVSNALKYSPSGSPISIRAERWHEESAAATPMVRISVQDAGLGVPPSEAPKLFQRFVRLERDIAGSVRGTGVGLYLCRTLVEAMGGRIWVQSTGKPGEGSTFSFTLPQTPPAIVIAPATEVATGTLAAGEPARRFTAATLDGQTLSLEDYAGKRVLLTFLRAASCPLCGVQVWQLVQNAPRWRQQGLETVAVIESDRAETQRYVERLQPPFPIIPDPQKRIFRQYGVTSSLFGMARGLLLRLGIYYQAWRKRVGGRISSGDLGLLPADFLISPDLVVQRAYYGKDTGDHLPLREIDAFAEEHGGE